MSRNTVPAMLDIPCMEDDDIRMRIFASEDEAGSFYNTYAKLKGFSTRKDERRINNLGIATTRQWVCSKQGSRDRKFIEMESRVYEPRPETRSGCPAKFRIRFDGVNGRYYVSNFISEHNHQLIEHGAHFLPSHRGLKAADKAMASALRGVGVRGHRAMDYFTQQAGNPSQVGFIPVDLRNNNYRDRKHDVLGGDAETVLNYFDRKKVHDQNFFYMYNTDQDKRLDRLFWSDSISRADYAIFGDVLTFDATYRTNAYNMPFVIFQGVNNHYRTIIYGCAIVASETITNYEWVLNAFLNAMNGKQPTAVITDGDHAMKSAIITVFPNAKHRLCMWHLERNATKKVHAKDFLRRFKECMELEGTLDEFNAAWRALVDDFQLHNKKWANEVFAKRHMWSTVYLKGIFFAGMTTTQRCESINSYLYQFIEVRLRFIEVVQAYEIAVRDLREKTLQAQVKAEYSSPVINSALRHLQSHGAKVYTPSLFKIFKQQLDHVIQIFNYNNTVNMGSVKVYYLAAYNDNNQKTWIVRYDSEGRTINCNCNYFPFVGIPCSHMIAVMKNERMQQIPASCIVARWTKSAQSMPCTSADDPSMGESASIIRYGCLSGIGNKISYYASRAEGGFEIAAEKLTALEEEMRDLYLKTNGESINEMDRGNRKQFDVQDPPTFLGKGKRSGAKDPATTKRKCTICRLEGHARNRCPNNIDPVVHGDSAANLDDPHDVDEDDENGSPINLGDPDSTPIYAGEGSSSVYANNRSRPGPSFDYCSIDHDCYIPTMENDLFEG